MRRKTVALLLLVILVLPALSACEDTNSSTGRPKDPKNIAPALALKLREDYLQYLISNNSDSTCKLEEIWVQKYFGAYSGCEVVYMGSNLNHTDAQRTVEIAGYVIDFPSGQRVYAYRDSMFYTLKKAYYMGLITQQDVYAIGKKVSPSFAGNNPNPNVQIEQNLNGLSPAMIQHMREVFLEDHQGQGVTIEEVWVNRYLGNYSGCEAVCMDTDINDFVSGGSPRHIADYEIIIDYGKLWPRIYKESQFYELSKAYDAGLITKQDVYDIAVQLDSSFKERYPYP